MNFFDTSVLVASLVSHHTHHPQSLARIAKMRQTGGACSAHSLAETYNTLTRVSTYGFSPLLVSRALQVVQQEFTLVTLSQTEMLRAIEAAAVENLAGSLIFDFLILACARKAHATAIYTGKTKHFRKIAPDLASIIHEP